MQFSPNLKRYITSIITTSAIAFSTQIFAGGFQLWEQDAADTGDYHAGAAAEANNAASVFYNAANATHIKHQQISFGTTFIPLDVSFTGTANGIPVNNASGDTFNIVPNFSYVLPIDHNKWAFAFSTTSPFGLATSYEDTSYVNLLATKTELDTVNLNPSVAYAVNRYLSLGVGFDALYGQATYNSDVFQPLTTDLSGWNVGYNAGVLMQFTPETRMGLSYRSAITVTAKGNSQSTSIFTGLPITSTASAQFPLPATTILSLYHNFNSRFTMMASAFYTQWSVFKELIIQNITTPTGTGTVALNEDYRNTWNLALGGKYKLNNHFSLEAGVGHDETPTRLGYRDIRLPDNNRYAASLGVNIEPKPGFVWNIGWTHFFVPTTLVNNTLSNDTSKTTTIAPAIGLGTVHGDANVFGIQFSCDI